MDYVALLVVPAAGDDDVNVGIEGVFEVTVQVFGRQVGGAYPFVKSLEPVVERVDAAGECFIGIEGYG